MPDGSRTSVAPLYPSLSLLERFSLINPDSSRNVGLIPSPSSVASAIITDCCCMLLHSVFLSAFNVNVVI